jgi:hypothetical protein
VKDALRRAFKASACHKASNARPVRIPRFATDAV